MKNNLSYLLSTIELASNIDTGNRTLVDCENEILKQQPKWQHYLEQQSKLLQEAIKIFKCYDQTDTLKIFWLELKNKEATFSEDTFNLLFQFALQAYDQGILEDAYKMFSFISTYYPRHYKSYIYLGSVVQSLYGPEEAATFYKIVTSIFSEPDLLFLSAENEIQRENTENAHEYLKKAENILLERNNLTEDEEGLKVRIEELLKLFNS